jgi:exodeoxyribonuclease VII large subunit
MPEASNIRELTVSELSAALKRTVEAAFGSVRLRGEVSGWKVPASGHAYFTLKDAEAVLDAVMWKGSRQRLSFAPEDGVEVVASGRLTTYPGRSKYQIIVEAMELAGEGALLAMIEKRRALLAAEGLFDPARKQPIPYLPARIGIVTSPTGAVIRDILHRLQDRFPRDVLLWPVKVQGEGAAEEVAAAVGGFNHMESGPDLIIIARGGGSIEDLMPFNAEVVVRAVAASRIPVISAVGHETDTTLIDFAADLRAPTPTAAAELAVPVRAELVATTSALGARSDAALAKLARQRGERLHMLAARLPRPTVLFGIKAQTLDDTGERLPRALKAALAQWTARLDRSAGPLGAAMRARLASAREAFGIANAGLRPALIDSHLRRQRQRLDASARLLASLSPLAVLARGYAVVERTDGSLVKSAAAARAERALRLRFADDDRRVEVAVGGTATPATRRPTQKAGGDGPSQSTLFE